MNSNYSILRFKYEEKKWSVTLEKRSHRKENTDYNVDSTRISDNPHAFNFVISKIKCLQKTLINKWVPTPLHQVNANIYINDFSPQEDLITE